MTPAEAMEYVLNEAQEWFRSAVEGTLEKPGDDYELPNFIIELAPWHVLHPETSIDDIISLEACWGTLQYGIQGNRIAISKWDDGPWNEPHEMWPRNLEQEKLGEWSIAPGGWVYVPFEPAFKPKRPPETMDDLREIFQRAKLDFKAILWSLLGTQNKQAWAFLLVGFPVPVLVGDSPTMIHWQGLRLPVPRRRVNGFPNTQEGRFEGTLVKGELAPYKDLEWMKTYNINPEQLLARVPEGHRLREVRAVVLGCGALGSTVALELVKAGVQWIGLVDYDSLEPGNISRHVLGMNDVGEKKASSLEARLYQINPSVEVKVLLEDAMRTIMDPSKEEIFHEANVWIDTTGEPGVALFLGAKAHELGRSIASIFITYGARHAALFLSDPKSGTSLEDVEGIFKKTGETSQDPLIKAAYNDLWGEPRGEMVRTAPGCYDVTFPAAGYDISFCAAYLTKALTAAHMQGGWHGLILSNPENPWEEGLRVVWSDRGQVPK